jgi:hypothetical protein
MRIVNHVYASSQFLPHSRIPGFIFHQTERTADNGTNACFGNVKECWDSNARDFDLLGYKYSLLSTVGTAGQNNVLTMIPARDEAEWALFPAEDVRFIQDWLKWTDLNLGYLRNTFPIATLPAPGVGKVDGTHAMDDAGDGGFLFLFNPNFLQLAAPLSLDESMGLAAGSATDKWTVTEIYPNAGEHVGVWARGQATEATVLGSDARVLQLTKQQATTQQAGAAGAAAAAAAAGAAAAAAAPSVVGLPLPGAAALSADGSELSLASLSGPAGTVRALRVSLPAGAAAAANAARANGVACSPDSPAAGGKAGNASGAGSTGTTSGALQLDVRFSGTAVGDEPVTHGMAISQSAVQPPGEAFPGGWFNTTFSVPAAVTAQLAQRSKAYPVPWAPADFHAAWLVPTRLLLFPFLSPASDQLEISMAVDGAPVQLTKAYNSRGLVRPRCFLGFYFDATALAAAPGEEHAVALKLPPMRPGQFQGLFWENVETVYTQSVQSCTFKVVEA